MLTALIADDEPPARKRLRKLLSPLEQTGRVQVVAEATDGVETLDLLKEHTVDLLFLDIRMPELGGFDVLERLPLPDRPVVVFTTAYDAHALQAFEANAVDYLLKPIGKDRLHEAVQRAERLTHGPKQDEFNERLNRLLDWMENQSGDDESPDPKPTPLRQLSVPFRDRILVISTADLVSAEINEGITRLYVKERDAGSDTVHLRQYAVSYTLDQLESNLDADEFARVHRSALVQLGAIREMIPWFSGRYKLMLTGNHEVIASRERSKLLKERLML